MAKEEAQPTSQSSAPTDQHDASQQDTKKWSRLVAQAWTDPNLKQRLLNTPAAVLLEHGIAVPPGLDVRIVENTGEIAYFMLPAKTADFDPVRGAQPGGGKSSWQLLEKIWTDDKFKQRLLTSPATVLQEFGIPVSAGLDIRVVENTDKVSYLALPPKPSDSELTSTQLDAVVGGRAAFSCTVESWVGAYCGTNVYNYVDGWIGAMNANQIPY